MTYRGFVPQPTPETAPFWLAAREGRLVLQRCDDCQAVRFPPQPGCPQCGSAQRSWIEAAGTGTVFSYVVNHRPAPGFDGDRPYCTAVVELAEGVRMMAPLAGVEAADDLSLIDAEVEVQFRTVTDEISLPWFRPVSANHG